MEDCIFCKIVAGGIPVRKVYEDANSIAFLDINPRNPGHTLVIPKGHAQDIFSISEDEATELMGAIRKVAIGVRDATGTEGMTITQSNGKLAGQLVPHMHFHLIPRTEKEKGVGLEGVLPIKKQDDASLDEMARRISESIAKDVSEELLPKEEPEPQKEEAEASKPKSPEDQDISFDF